jgi:hypothetical protein
MKLSRTAAPIALAAVLFIGVGPAGAGTAARPAAATSAPSSFVSVGRMFQVNPFLGGQVAPRFYVWTNRNVLVFLQFDRPQLAEAKALRYVGIGVRGTFCAETQPGGANGGFTHFHRLTAPAYAQGHGGPPGTEGYWLMWVAVDNFDAFDGRAISPGVDYGFSPTPPPSCGGAPKPNFAGPRAHALTKGEIKQLAAAFYDTPFRGGQRVPRLYRWVTGDTLVFLQFDRADPAKARALRYVGVAKRGALCSADRGPTDFTSFQAQNARTLAKGHGGRAGRLGFWHLAVAVDDFRMPWGNVTPGVDREFSVTRPPDCPKA